ncbi:MAG TPA: hypothetical protein VGO53_03795 [Steroidobacteraceae bacterium]|jgi:hypothetical protein|nr:hypothetical protein [Steroidobacteraceae bacterium]
MAYPGDNEGKSARISSLRELARDIPPPRDLWTSISAEISNGGQRSGRSRFAPSGMQWLALAAVVSALAVGVWVGRTLLPVGGSQPPAQIASANGANANGQQQLTPASYVTDPRYLKQRATMIHALEDQLKTLPPETRQKVATSLATIRKSMTDIEAALGHDPGNALLQELLVNSYQDEMRVLTAVHEASDAGQET